jgi:hypothetical protein
VRCETYLAFLIVGGARLGAFAGGRWSNGSQQNVLAGKEVSFPSRARGDAGLDWCACSFISTGARGCRHEWAYVCDAGREPGPLGWSSEQACRTHFRAIDE